MGPLQFPQANKTLFSIDRRLEAGFKSLCCSLANGPGTQLIPVYEYRIYYSALLSDGVLGVPYYPYSYILQATQIDFTFGANVTDMCSDFSEAQDPIQLEIVYRDSIGRTIYSSGGGATLTVPTADYPEYTIKFQIEIQRTSGFRQVLEGTYEIDNTGAVIDNTLINLQVYSNSNTSNGTNPNGILPVTYEVPVKDIYAIFTNGVFVKYIDMAGADYTPTYCLSTNPVMPFTSLDYEVLQPIYDTNVVQLVSNSSFTLNANTVHNVTFTVMSSTLDLTIGATSVSGLPTGTTQTLSASKLINEAITFDTSGSGGSVVITYTIPTSL